MAKRVFFRGDDRHPHFDRIFDYGFFKQNPATQITYRQPNPNRAGDIDSVTAVCVSARFTAAAMFPLRFNANEPRVDTYVYAVCLDVGQVVNTHARQVNDSLTIGMANDPQAANVMWPLFGHELATDSIHPGEIIAAVPCRRYWHGMTWQQGGTYTLLPLLKNVSCGMPNIWVTNTLNFLRQEIQIASDPTAINPPELPKGDSGYHRT